jgi:hypothetical protein
VGAAFFILLGLGALFSVPLLTALFARSMSRPFFKWLFIGALLPIIAVVIVFLLPDISKKESALEK